MSIESCLDKMESCLASLPAADEELAALGDHLQFKLELDRLYALYTECIEEAQRLRREEPLEEDAFFSKLKKIFSLESSTDKLREQACRISNLLMARIDAYQRSNTEYSASARAAFNYIEGSDCSLRGFLHLDSFRPCERASSFIPPKILRKSKL